MKLKVDVTFDAETGHLHIEAPGVPHTAQRFVLGMAVDVLERKLIAVEVVQTAKAQAELEQAIAAGIRPGANGLYLGR